MRTVLLVILSINIFILLFVIVLSIAEKLFSKEKERYCLLIEEYNHEAS